MGTCLKFPLHEFLEKENCNLNKSIDNNINNDSNISIDNNPNIQTNLVMAELLNDINDQMKPGPKMKIGFQSNNGFNFDLIVNEEATIDSTLQYYLRRINRAEYIGSNEIYFIYNAIKMHFGDKTPVREYFGNSRNPYIVIIDMHNYLYYNWEKEEDQSIKEAEKILRDEIIVKFNKYGEIINIELSKYYIVSELLNKYRKKVFTFIWPFQLVFNFSGTILSQEDLRFLYELDLNNNSEIKVFYSPYYT